MDVRSECEGNLSKGAPACYMGEAHSHTLVLAQPQLHVLAVHAACRPLTADAPLAGLAQVRITLPVCTCTTTMIQTKFCHAS